MKSNWDLIKDIETRNAFGMLKAIVTAEIKNQNTAIDYIKEIADLEFRLSNEIGVKVIWEDENEIISKSEWLNVHIKEQRTLTKTDNIN